MAECFAWGDITRVQGRSPQEDALLKSEYFIGGLTMDMNHNYSHPQPKDHANSGDSLTPEQHFISTLFSKRL